MQKETVPREGRTAKSLGQPFKYNLDYNLIVQPKPIKDMDKALCKKMLLVMRITAFIICAALMQVHATGYGQGITLSAKNISLVEVFSSIEKQSGYLFLYEDGTLEKTHPVSVDIKNATLEDALDACFFGQPLTWRVFNRNIVVRKKEISADTLGDLHGTIINEKGEPVPRATISIKGTDNATITNEKGEFTLKAVPVSITLVITSVGYERQEIIVRNHLAFTVRLKTSAVQLGNVEVIYSSGYQNIPKERATGSFVQIDNELINRSVSTDILSRLDGVTSGVLFNKNLIPTSNQSTITIRGRSTIFSNPNPLIIVDNFPYDGDINNINPNDVESITVLKDAAAASIWGAFSGNGVIVITTKKGRYNQPLRVSFNTNFTVGQKPDLWYSPQMNSSDFIGVQKFLYDQGKYTASISDPAAYIPPPVDIFNKLANGQISQADANNQLNALANTDTRNEISKYYYRPATSQQYAVNFSGGGANNQFYFSAGYDKNHPTFTRNDYERFTLSANNLFSFIDHRLELTANIVFTSSRTVNDNSGYQSFPYTKLIDANGNHLAVNQYKQSFIDTTGGGLLLDWNNRPLDELASANNSTKLTDYRINTGIKFKIIAGLEINVQYQYSKGVTDGNNFNSQETYFTRNLINSYSQVDESSNSIVRPIPLGGILDLSSSSYESNNLRGQLNYTHNWNKAHQLSAIAGAEIRQVDGESRTYRQYGYDPDHQTYIPVDYVNSYPNYIYSFSYSLIPDNVTNLATTNRYISYFGNAAYTYKERYTVSASARQDESNLFGVSANQKGVPLWSAGMLWEVSKEKFYSLRTLPYLRLRLTDGYNGNVNNSVSAYTTSALSGFPNTFNVNFQNILNPPNPQLRWERINVINIGLDFATRNKRISGTFEYYQKYGTDLIGQSPVAPQTGVSTFTGNTADMRGEGVDLTISTINVDKKVKWYTVFLFNFNTDKVTSYKATPGAIYNYLNPAVINPLEGHPLYSVYSYKWAGLDQQGNPQGYLDGKISEDYGGILNSTRTDNLKYNGPVNPTFFGSLRNTITYHQFSFSFNISYKFGYYFRRPSLSYTNLLDYEDPLGQVDYNKRWQNPGDENKTNVPSQIYPNDPSRSDFYTYSEILVDKADQIRLQDIQLSYDVSRFHISTWNVSSIRFYLYLNNIGILWSANHDHIDPDYVPGFVTPVYPNPKTLSFGMRVNF
jgi:TonB-linked SusC/RagA family outer membrane protein